VSLSPSALSFGTVGVGTPSAAKAVTVTNTGDAALTISDATVTGADFALGDDMCGGHTVAAGASCTTAVTFTPAAAGARDGQLAFTDDASGSPHTVTLSGIGNTTGAVTGTVLDGGKAGTPPLPGAPVTLCTIALNGCSGTVSDAQGHYRFGGVKADSYTATIYPPSGSTLSDGSRLADVAVGQTVDAVTVLKRAAPLPDGLALTTPFGGAGSHPTLYWDDPFDVDLPLAPLGATGPPNRRIATTVFVTLTAAGSGQLVAGSAITYGVRYDADGKAARATELDTPLPGTVRAGFRFVLGDVATRPHAVSAPPTLAVAAAAHLTAKSDGLHRLAHGPLELSVFGVRTDGATKRSNPGCDIYLDYTQRYEQGMLDLLTELESIRKQIDQAVANGEIVDNDLYAAEDLARSKLEGLEEAYAEEVDKIYLFCEPEPPCDDNIFNQTPCPAGGPIAVDPSGNVFTKRGVPLEHAKVVLQRSDVAKGPFGALPDGDSRMAPNNRRNPDRTDIDGHFGWDVFPGYYRVRATRKGCRGSARTKGLPVPPPVFNLRLKLRCPGLHRAKTRTRVVRVRRRGPDTVVKVRVRARHAPVGLVTVAGVNGFLRHGRTTVVLPAHRKHVVARYAGNARWAPSRGRG
jgi:hypothetical protein